MRIIGSELSLYAERSYARSEVRQERLSITRGSNSPARAMISLSPEARALASRPEPPSQATPAAKKVESADDNPSGDDAKLALLIQLIEAITGRPVRLFNAAELQASDSATEAPPSPVTAAEAPPVERVANPSGIVIEFERRHAVSETEVTRFEAVGRVRTADGREIEFRLSLEMARQYQESSVERIRIGAEAQRKDPLVLNFSGNAASLQDQRFDFDLDADGQSESIAHLGAGSAYLVFDRNADGRVNSGSELFGALSGDGFADLATLDRDGNGWLDEDDPEFARLRVWSPNIQGGGALSSLAERGVAAIATANVASAFSLRGSGNSDLGAVRSTGLYLSESGKVGTTQQIDLSV